MALTETFWMACSSTDHARVEYGPYATRAEAEQMARRMQFGYLLRYEHVVGDEDEIQDVRSIFIEFAPSAQPASVGRTIHWHTRCASCGVTAMHEKALQAEVWADIHEFENTRHKVRLFERTEGQGLREISQWRRQIA